MSIWAYLFDSDYAQRRDLIALQKKALKQGAESGELWSRLRAVEDKAGRLELILEALVELGRVKGLFTKEELTLMIQRIDLADGVEDGRIGPDRAAQAPACPQCERPVNPQREACVYCGAELPPELEKESTAHASGATIPCAVCQRETPEHEMYFNEQGLVCRSCFGM